MLVKSHYSPEDALSEIHGQHKRADADSLHKFRFFSVATTGSESQKPESHMVVLRTFDEFWNF